MSRVTGIIAVLGATLSTSVAHANEASMGGGNVGSAIGGSGGSALLAGGLVLAAALTGLMRRQVRH